MKTSISHQINLVVAVVILSGCNFLPSQSPYKQNIFTGKYQGNYENSLTTVEITAENQSILGVFTLDTRAFTINATSTENTLTGEIVDEESGNFHTVIARLSGNMLHLQITFPEHNYQVLELSLQRTNDIATAKNFPALDKVTTTTYQPKNLNGDIALVGKWRFTEVLSSGIGEFYASFSTDYFLRINSDGTAVSWIGQSAGGNESMSIEGNYGSDIKEFGWYTKDNQFFVVDPAHKEANKSIVYYAEQNRIMLSNGDKKRVFERIE